MKSNSITRGAVLPCVLAAAMLTTGCGDSITQLKNAVDSFDIIVELPKINTVIAGQVIDASTRAPITSEVTLAFSGPAASRLIDAYSDPVASAKIRSGTLTVGLDNAVVPTPAAPVTFTVTASASGYFPQTKTVTLTGTDGQGFTIELVPSSSSAAIEGSTAVSNKAGSATNGTVAATVTTTAPLLPGTDLPPSVSIPAGTALSTASGQPLSGELTTSLRVFSPDAISALPDPATQSGDEILDVFGAAVVEISDATGRVAGETGTAGDSYPYQSSARVLAGANVTLVYPISAFGYYQNLYNLGWKIRVRAYNYSSRTLVDLPSCSSNLDANRRALVLTGGCVGYLVFDLVRAQTAPPSCTANVAIRITNPNSYAVTSPAIMIYSPTVSRLNWTTRTIAAGQSISVSANEILGGLKVRPSADYGVYISANNTITVKAPFSPCSGTVDVALPVQANVQTYSVQATVACPAGKKFDPQFTDASLGGLQLFYAERLPSGRTGAFTTIARSRLATSVSPSSITIATSLALKTNTEYQFNGVFGSKSGVQVERTPAAGGAMGVALSADQVGLTCKS